MSSMAHVPGVRARRCLFRSSGGHGAPDSGALGVNIASYRLIAIRRGEPCAREAGSL